MGKEIWAAYLGLERQLCRSCEKRKLLGCWCNLVKKTQYSVRDSQNLLTLVLCDPVYTPTAVQRAKSLLLLILRAAFRKSLLRLGINTGLELDTVCYIKITIEITFDHNPVMGLFTMGAQTRCRNTKPRSDIPFSTPVDTLPFIVSLSKGTLKAMHFLGRYLRDRPTALWRLDRGRFWARLRSQISSLIVIHDYC